jgi:hypothetical protein
LPPEQQWWVGWGWRFSRGQTRCSFSPIVLTSPCSETNTHDI